MASKDEIARVRKENNVELQKIAKTRRVTDYLAAAMIYLRGNFLLKEKLSMDDIKPRLLGHWGTCPGLNFAYAHANYLLRKQFGYVYSNRSRTWSTCRISQFVY